MLGGVIMESIGSRVQPAGLLVHEMRSSQAALRNRDRSLRW